MRKARERRTQYSFLETVPPCAVTSSENWVVRVSTCVAGTSWRAMKTFSYNAIRAPYGCQRPGVLANRPDLATPVPRLSLDLRWQGDGADLGPEERRLTREKPPKHTRRRPRAGGVEPT